MNLKSICALVCSILVVCGCVFFPEKVLEFHEQSLTEQVFVKPVISLSDDSESHSVMNTLEIMGTHSEAVFELDVSENLKEIQNQVMEQLRILYDLGITIPYVSNPHRQDIHVQSAIQTLRTEKDRTAYVYRIYTEKGHIWLDAESGKIVQMRLWMEKKEDTTDISSDWQAERKETTHSPTKDLDAWAEYYGLSASAVADDPMDLQEVYPYGDHILFVGFLEDSKEQKVGFAFSYQDPSGSTTEIFDINPVSAERIEELQNILQG